MRILICDDEGIVQQAIRFMIQKSFGDEFEIESAKNGRMAIELAESFRPDIILMDIQMPNMDGYRATEMIRGLSDKDKATIPIIAMTANAFEEDRKKALAEGMNGHIAKPVDAEKVKKTILSALSRQSEQVTY